MTIKQSGTDFVRVICEFVAAWNACDGAARRRHLERCWSGAGCFVDPTTRCIGLAPLLAYIGQCHDAAPDARYVIASIDTHHHRACVAWTLQDPNGREMLAGRSVGEFDAAGRLRSLAAFLLHRIELPATA